MTLTSRVGTLALVALLVGVAAPARGGTPTRELRGSIDQVLDILKDRAPKARGNEAERDAALRHVVEARFDFAATAHEALGPYWRGRTPEERRRFTALFTELLERSYLTTIEKSHGAHVEYVGERIEGDRATVRTRIVTDAGTEIPVDYRLSPEGDRWLVYDVLIERVSLVDNYRSQFRDIIAISSYQNLVKRIADKLDELRARARASRTSRLPTSARAGPPRRRVLD